MTVSLYYNSLKMLDNWISKNGWSGYDPYDLLGLTPFIILQKNTIGRFIAIRLSNMFPITLRRIFHVKKTINPKAMGLFARGYLLLYKKTKDKLYLDKAMYTLNWLMKNYTSGYSGFAWGYPFDWQSRVFIPKYTPSSVVTSIVAHAFLDAYEILKDKKYLEVAISATKFLVNDLNIDYIDEDKLCFSYTPLDNFHVHNANTWVASVLLRVYAHTKDYTLKELAVKAINYTISDQNEDGSWYYWGPPDKRRYVIDNYHTGFVLETLNITRKILGDEFSYERNLRKGLAFYIKNFFLSDGTPKMAPKSTYPIDIHSAAQGIITCKELENLDPECSLLAERIAEWTIKNMQDPKEGYFYYRIYKNRIDKTPYIRWGQAWMLRALSYLVGDGK